MIMWAVLMGVLFILAFLLYITLALAGIFTVSWHQL